MIRHGIGLALFLASPAGAQQLALPPETAGNVFECFNTDGDGASCNHHRSGSWITGDSDGVKDVVLTDEGSLIIPTGSFRRHVVDYRVHFNQADGECGSEPIVETPHHPPFVLEFSRYYRTRATQLDYGLTRGWRDNYLYLLDVTQQAGYRTARFEVPSGATMYWIDVGSTGNWVDDNVEMQSMVLTLADQPGGQFLVSDRWGGKYHFVPNTSGRDNLQYLLDWLEDENGNRITLTHGPDGYPTQAADGFGRALTYTWTPGEFNGSKHLSGVTLPNGRTLSFQYFFDNQRFYTLTYPNGDQASYGQSHVGGEDYRYFHDPLGTPGARKQRVFTYLIGPDFLYDSGRVRAIQDETGHVQLIRLEDPLTPKITIEYDDGRGYSYDCAFAGLNERITDLRTGAVTELEWQLNGGMLKRRIDALGQWITGDYDDARALQTLRRELGYPETWSYGPHNRVEDHVDANGNLVHHDYDARGNLVRRTHPDASYEEWTRHLSGRVTAYRNRNGHTTTYAYDARGNVSQIVLPAQPSEASPVIAFTYDVDGRLLSRTDPRGRVTSHEYDLLGRRVRTLYPDGTDEELAYGSMNVGNPADPVGTAGLVVARTDRNGHTTAYQYGPNDRLVRESGAPGEILYAYDAQDRLVSRTENGDTEAYGHDSSYRRTSVTRAVDATQAHTTTFAYDLLDRVVSSVDPHGFTTTWSWAGQDRLTVLARQVEGATTAVTVYTHDGNGNVVLEDDGRPRSYTYDADDRRVRSHDPAPYDANYVELTYAPGGQLLARRDQAGNVTTYAYTSRGQLALETDPTGVAILHAYDLDDSRLRTERPATAGLRLFAYDSGGWASAETVAVDGGAKDMSCYETRDGRGQVVTRIDGEGGLRSYEYDARGRLVRAIDPLGEETLTTHSDDGAPFDARLAPGQGHAVSVTDPLGHTTTTVYDGAGRVIREIDAVGRSTTWTHDMPFGSLEGTLRTDRMGRTTAEYRDGLGRVVRSVDELGQVTGRAWDVWGNLVRIDDPRGNATHFTYDSRGLHTSTIYPDPLDVVTFAYHANGLLAERVDQLGLSTQYAYDGAGRLVGVTYPGGLSDAFVHDAGGRLVQATSGEHGNTVTFTYDRADRVVAEDNVGTVLLDYDRRSLPTLVVTPSGREFRKTYTARGELDTLALGPDVLLDDDHDADGRRVQRTLANGTSTTWARNALERTQSIRHARGPEMLLELGYQRDPEGRKLKQRNLANMSRSETYQYDAAGRLLHYRGKVPYARRSPPLPDDEEKGVTKVEDWVLDPLGNWQQYRRNGTLQHRTHSGSNQLASISGVGPLQYKRGNLDDDGTYTYAYDWNDRLKEVRRKSDDQVMAQYGYDALSRRLTRTSVEKTTLAQRRFRYTYAGREIVELREMPAVGPPEFRAAFAHGAGPQEPLVMVRPGQTYHFHANAAGSIVLLTDEDGDVAERYEYDPYGRTQVLTGQYVPIGDTSGLLNPFAFQGYENDSEAGVILLGGRALSPSLGRFLQRDPRGPAAGVNTYSAAHLVHVER